MADVPVPSIVTATPDGDDTVLGVKDGLVKRFTLDNVGAGINFSAVNATTNMVFNTNGTEKMRLDSSGNLGLGVTPSAWNIQYKALQIPGAAFWGTTGYTFITSNGYANSSDVLTYVETGYACNQIRMDSGGIKFSTAPSGTAGNPITFTQAMTLDASGNLGVGTSSPTQKLDVAGIGRFYSDMGGNFGGGFVLENSASGATNGAKNFRISPTGTLQLINSAYSAVIHEFYNDGSFLASGNISAPAFYDSGNTAFYLDPANTGTSMVVAGNVGIGTTSPSSKLVVSNAGAAGFEVNPTGSASAPALYSYNRSTNAYDILTTLASEVRWQTGSSPSERMRLDASGNLIQTVNTTAATLGTNNTLTFSIVDNSTLRISVRGSDGTTRTATVALT